MVALELSRSTPLPKSDLVDIKYRVWIHICKIQSRCIRQRQLVIHLRCDRNRFF
ncbi:hypothetical protein Gotur_006477 [Gossypium turneri]